ncbi:hypothetical protein KFU94_36260 [Chloroflexi bacterium TSY]|nr:hypothetical protein [Chloroflexi bacterium TSY]
MQLNTFEEPDGARKASDEADWFLKNLCVHHLSLNDQGSTNAKSAHLTEDELRAYLDKRLDEGHFVQADSHIQSCLICGRRLAILQEENEAFRQGRITEKDIALVQQLIGTPTIWNALADQIQNILIELGSVLRGTGATAGFAAAATETDDKWRQGQTPEGIHWSIGREGTAVILEVRSEDLTLADVELQLQAGDWQQTTVLKRIAPHQVGTVILISQDEFAQWQDQRLEISSKSPGESI